MLDSREPTVDSTLKKIFEEHGFSMHAVTTAAVYKNEQARYTAWIEAGYNGEMHFLENHAAAKYNPHHIVEDARSVIILGMPYYHLEDAGQEKSTRDSGLVARYARGRDYHRVIGKKLKALTKKLRELYPGHTFRGFTDAGPLDEVFYGDKSLLGFTGRHGLLISQKYGSYFFLADIVTSLELEPSSGRDKGQCPGSCRRCIQSCPTGALVCDSMGHTFMNASVCISYLTIEYKGIIAEELRPLIGKRIFGCDDCQSVCPFNVNPHESYVDDFKAVRAGREIDILQLLKMDEEAFFHVYKGTPLMRPGIELMQRNALIVAGNSGNKNLLPDLKAFLKETASELLKEHCSWAIERLGGE